MRNDLPSDKQIIAQDERYHRAIFITIGSFVALLATSILLFFAGGAGFIPIWLLNLLAMALLAGWLLFVFVRIKPGMAPPDVIYDEKYLRKTVDFQHRRWRYTIVFTLLMLCQLAYLLTHTILNIPLSHSRNSDFKLMLFSWTFAIIALLAVLTVAFGPGFFLPYYRRALNDELVRAQHAKTVQFGYLLAIIEMGAVLVMAAYEPQWVIASLPSVLTVAIVVPGIYFLILEWRASRSG